MIRMADVLLACLFASTAEAAVGAVSFVGLLNGDTLWIKYESSGCFHSYRADLTLYGREPNLAHLEVWNFGILGRTDPWGARYG